jgi:hypothetical protein
MSVRLSPRISERAHKRMSLSCTMIAREARMVADDLLADPEQLSGLESAPLRQ